VGEAWPLEGARGRALPGGRRQKAVCFAYPSVQARGATFLSFMVGGLVALLTAYSYVRLSLTYPGEGGTVTFVNRAFGRGRFAGGLNLLLVLSYVVIMALYAGAFANYAGGLLPGFTRAIGPQALAPGIIVLLALVNLVGPQLVEQSEGFFNAGKLGILLVFIIVKLASPALTLARLGPAELGTAGGDRGERHAGLPELRGL